MRKRIKPVVLLVFFIGIISFLVLSRTIADLQARERQETTKTIPNSNTPRKTTTASSSSKKEEDINPELVGRPIIDISGWQLPSEIDYDVLSQNVGGVIVRVHSGAQAKKENAATYLNGLDKSFKTHIQEFQKRNIPVAVYAYVAAKDKKEMEKEAEEFYKAASPYKPTYYWLDVEEKTMKDMNVGVEAFRAKLQALGAKILDSISEPTSWKNIVSPLINLRLFGFLLMDLMMATIMPRQIPTRNTTCINIPLKGN